MRRAHALQRTGRIFQDVWSDGSDNMLDTDDAKSKIEQAFITTITKEQTKEKEKDGGEK